ncbi:hypothetical protein [Clostridium sp.]|uniref:hypothetical protein n=1 Tax=Clostridium sp. TaxID=1506 RepID=UPI0025BEB9CF|nr:hypothetical protein [Clostridium sp.]
MKIFPDNEVSMDYSRKVCELMGDLPLMAVGGISAKNVKEAFLSGYRYVGTAGGLFKKNDIIHMNKENLIKSLKNFEQELN